MVLERKTYGELPEIKGPYVHAVRHGSSLYVSGLTALGTPAQSGDAASQTREVLAQFAKLLAAEGLDISAFIKTTIFVTAIADLPAIREELAAFYGSHLPACSLVEVSQLVHPDLVVEIEGIVALT